MLELQLCLLLWGCHLVVGDVVGLLIVDVVGDGVLPGCPHPAVLPGLVWLFLGPVGQAADPLLGDDVVAPLHCILALLSCLSAPL